MSVWAENKQSSFVPTPHPQWTNTASIFKELTVWEKNEIQSQITKSQIQNQLPPIGTMVCQPPLECSHLPSELSVIILVLQIRKEKAVQATQGWDKRAGLLLTPRQGQDSPCPLHPEPSFPHVINEVTSDWRLPGA